MSTETTVALTIANYGEALARLGPSVVPGVDIATLVAIVAVEAAGQGIEPSTGLPTIRFENHVFWDRWGKLPANRAVFTKHFKFNTAKGTKVWEGHLISEDGATWTKIHVGKGAERQNLEYRALNLAKSLDPTAAIESASWGAGQIMGYHWKALGFDSPQALVLSAGGMYGQLDMLLRFIAMDNRLVNAARSRDWRAFALQYNGKGQVETYSRWLNNAYMVAKAQGI